MLSRRKASSPGASTTGLGAPGGPAIPSTGAHHPETKPFPIGVTPRFEEADPVGMGGLAYGGSHRDRIPNP